jgi:hypothetical protein
MLRTVRSTEKRVEAGATYAIIAGSNKCGTTSLFRYLSDHPDVRATRVKELLFWKTPPTGPREAVLSEYESQFIRAKREARVRLEGTPNYLYLADSVAAVMRNALPDARLIFLIRDPAQRLASAYKAAYGQRQHVNYSLRFEEVVDLALRHYRGDRSDPRGAAMAYELKVGQYARLLKVYERIWPLEQMQVMFYEHMARDMRGELKSAARYLGLDESFYDGYEFVIEHKSRSHRWELLLNIGVRLNQILLPVLTHNVWLKRTLHRIYFGINEAKRPIVIEPGALERLNEFYRDGNAELAEWMRTNYPGQPLPGWLGARAPGTTIQPAAPAAQARAS